MPLPSKIVFVDTETTGGSTFRDRVIEIGIVRVENNRVVKKFQTLLNPERYLPEEITHLTGITGAQLDAAPSFYQIKNEILELFDDAVMVAHNARFDYSFLKNEFRHINQNFSPKHFCTVKLSRTLFPQYPHHNLDSIIERFGFKVKKRHRAFDDAYVLWQFYQKILKQFEEQIIAAAINRDLKRPTVPIKITQQELDQLPESPGVYIFYGERGMPLYIGKSINIKKRVLSHFSADHYSPTEMKIAQQVENIETIITPGELGALFKESDLIKKIQPLYNRKLRYSRNLITLKQTLTPKGFFSILLTSTDQIKIDDLEVVLGMFKSKKALKQFLIYIAKENNLCEKLLGIEKTSGGCFRFRLGQCKGACLNKENPNEYNLRFEQAFTTLRLKSWPFNGTIAVTETDMESTESYLFNKWCYLGKIKYGGFEQTEYLEKDIKFDLDLYRILDQFLKNGKLTPKIKPINLNSFNF